MNSSDFSSLSQNVLLLLPKHPNNDGEYRTPSVVNKEKTHWTCDAFTFLKPAWFISFISSYTHPEFRFYYATLGHGRLKYVTQSTSVLLKRSNKQDCVHTVDGAGNVYQTHTKQLGGE